MFAAYGVDVLDPAVTPRRIWVLAQRLPPWSRLPGEEWSSEADLLALLVDHVAQLTYVTLQAAGAKGTSKPKPLPRPKRRHVPPPEPKGSWAAQLAAVPGVTVQVDDG